MYMSNLFKCILEVTNSSNLLRFNASSQKPQVHQGSALQPMNPSRNPRTESPAKNQIQDLKRTRSPPLLPTYKDILQNSRTVVVRQVTFFLFFFKITITLTIIIQVIE